MNVAYPTLTGEIAKRGVKKTAIAKRLGISGRSLYNKLSGDVSFTWDEVCTINNCFFPDMTPNDLFARADEDTAGASGGRLGNEQSPSA